MSFLHHKIHTIITIGSSSSTGSWDGLLHSSLLFFLLGFWVSYCLINWQNCACSFSCSLKCINLDKLWLPNVTLVVVSNSSVNIHTQVHVFNTSLWVSVSKSVDDVKWVHTSIVCNDLRNDFKWFGEHVHDELLFSWNFNCVFLESLWKCHLCGSSTCNNLVCLETSSDNHDGVVQWSFGFFDKLFSTTSQNDCGRFCLKLNIKLRVDIPQTSCIFRHRFAFLGNYRKYPKHQKQRC